MDEWWRITAIESSEWSSTSQRVAESVVLVFNPSQSSRPTTRLFESKTTEICLKAVIPNLCLAIGLKVMDCTTFESRSLQLKEFSLETTQKDAVIIKNYGLQNSMKVYDLPNKKVGDGDHGEGMFEPNKMSILVQTVLTTNMVS